MALGVVVYVLLEYVLALWHNTKCAIWSSYCDAWVYTMRKSLWNITALNENVMFTMLWKRLGVKTLKQQMLGQGVHYFTLPDNEGATLPSHVPPAGPYTLIVSYVPLQHGGGHYFWISGWCEARIDAWSRRLDEYYGTYFFTCSACTDRGRNTRHTVVDGISM